MRISRSVRKYRDYWTDRLNWTDLYNPWERYSYATGSWLSRLLLQIFLHIQLSVVELYYGGIETRDLPIGDLPLLPLTLLIPISYNPNHSPEDG